MVENLVLDVLVEKRPPAPPLHARRWMIVGAEIGKAIKEAVDEPVPPRIRTACFAICPASAFRLTKSGRSPTRSRRTAAMLAAAREGK